MRSTTEGNDGDAEHTALRFAQLRDVNEQLVLAAVRAQTEAEQIAKTTQAAVRAAELDSLTALPNRALLFDRFTHAAALARRHGTKLAILFLDLNDFKQINDALGHAAGDLVLKAVAAALAGAVRESDTVSRQGGDEFVLLLTDVAVQFDAAVMAEKILLALGAPVAIGRNVVRVQASIGVSIFPDDGRDAGVLVDRADAAMYRVKRRGGGGFAFHGDTDGAELQPLARRRDVRPHPVMHVEQSLRDHDLRHVQLQEANEKLVIAALGSRAMQAEAELLNRRQAEYMVKLAHELRNPLAPLYTVAALLARAQPDDPTLPKLHAIIERQVGHMSRMVDDLLDVTRASTGKLRLEMKVVELVDVLERSIEQRRPGMDVRMQSFVTQMPRLPLPALVDPVRLMQVVCNLLDNASKYTPNGGEIGLTLAAEGSNVVITVTDTGIGISAEALPHIFDLFTQDAHAVGFSGVGLGIGLTVVQELAHAHGGTVEAQSAGIGHGSRFIVTLPIAPPTWK